MDGMARGFFVITAVVKKEPIRNTSPGGYNCPRRVLPKLTYKITRTEGSVNVKHFFENQSGIFLITIYKRVPRACSIVKEIICVKHV